MYVSDFLSKEVLDKRHHATTNDHGHEQTRSGSSELAQTLGSQVEDNTPHNRSADTAQDDEQHLDGNLGTLESHLDIFGHEDGNQQQQDCE